MRPESSKTHSGCGSKGYGDSDLMARLLAGEEAAYRELVRIHGGRLLAVARRIMKDEDDARDCVQDAYTSAFQNLARFKGTARLSTWLHRITVNACLMRLRTRRRRGEKEALLDSSVSEFDAYGFRQGAAATDLPTPYELLESARIRERVRLAIDELPDQYRIVLLLQDIEGYDTAETADLLRLTVGAVKSRRHRARVALRNALVRLTP